MNKVCSFSLTKACRETSHKRWLSSRPPNKFGKKFPNSNRGRASPGTVDNSFEFPPAVTRYSKNIAGSTSNLDRHNPVAQKYRSPRGFASPGTVDYSFKFPPAATRYNESPAGSTGNFDRHNPVAEQYRADFRSRMIRKLKTIERRSFDRPPPKLNILSYRAKHQIYYLRSLSDAPTEEKGEQLEVDQTREYFHLKEHNEYESLNVRDIRDKILEIFPVSWSSLTAVLHSRIIFKDMEDIKVHDESLFNRWQQMLSSDFSELDRRLQMTLRDLVKSGQIVNMVNADGVDGMLMSKINLKTMPDTQEELDSISNRTTLRKTRKLLSAIRDKYSNLTIRDLDMETKPLEDEDENF